MSAIVCTRQVLLDTVAVLRRGGVFGEERVALWLASAAPRSPAPIADVYEPEQVADVDYFHIPASSMRSLMGHLRSTRRRIVAQIHTHPGRAFHSRADAAWAIIRHVGALSLVLPHFAKSTTPENFLNEVMTYEYDAEGHWAHRPNHEPDARVRVVP